MLASLRTAALRGVAARSAVRASQGDEAGRAFLRGFGDRKGARCEASGQVDRSKRRGKKV